eukprot:GHVP01054732.1.p1 GENE.GHVP01054732.1~~GHVP01054732.1.p1  ORF type:complete len:813 (+),score=160.09 GHVP01054732.1:67-2505(+)
MDEISDSVQALFDGENYGFLKIEFSKCEVPWNVDEIRTRIKKLECSLHDVVSEITEFLLAKDTDILDCTSIVNSVQNSVKESRFNIQALRTRLKDINFDICTNPISTLKKLERKSQMEIILHKLEECEKLHVMKKSAALHESFDNWSKSAELLQRHLTVVRMWKKKSNLACLASMEDTVMQSLRHLQTRLEYVIEAYAISGDSNINSFLNDFELMAEALVSIHLEAKPKKTSKNKRQNDSIYDDVASTITNAFCRPLENEFRIFLADESLNGDEKEISKLLKSDRLEIFRRCFYLVSKVVKKFELLLHHTDSSENPTIRKMGLSLKKKKTADLWSSIEQSIVTLIVNLRLGDQDFSVEDVILVIVSLIRLNFTSEGRKFFGSDMISITSTEIHNLWLEKRLFTDLTYIFESIFREILIRNVDDLYVVCKNETWARLPYDKDSESKTARQEISFPNVDLCTAFATRDNFFRFNEPTACFDIAESNEKQADKLQSDSVKNLANMLNITVEEAVELAPDKAPSEGPVVLGCVRKAKAIIESYFRLHLFLPFLALDVHLAAVQLLDLLLLVILALLVDAKTSRVLGISKEEQTRSRNAGSSLSDRWSMFLLERKFPILKQTAQRMFDVCYKRTVKLGSNRLKSPEYLPLDDLLTHALAGRRFQEHPNLKSPGKMFGFLEKLVVPDAYNELVEFLCKDSNIPLVLQSFKADTLRNVYEDKRQGAAELRCFFFDLAVTENFDTSSYESNILSLPWHEVIPPNEPAIQEAKDQVGINLRDLKRRFSFAGGGSILKKSFRDLWLSIDKFWVEVRILLRTG